MMRSASSVVREYLLQVEGVAGPYTAEQLLAAVKGYAEHKDIEVAPTIGGISGFMSKCVSAGAATPGASNGFRTYTITDKQKLLAMPTKGNPSKGGAEGRHTPRRRKFVADIPTIQQRLLDIAAELELARTPLATYTTEQLLAEIKRRMEQKE